MLSSLHYVAIAQKPKGNWSIGLTGSVDYFIRTLIDVERFNLDSTLLIGITDANYLAKREEIDKPYFPGKMAGFLLNYKISPRVELETGIRFVEGGSKIDMNNVSDFNLIQNVFGIENTSETIINKFIL